MWDYKSVLAHELGHAVNDDHFINHLSFNARQERRTNEYAADLEVTPHLLTIYLDTHPLELKEETA